MGRDGKVGSRKQQSLSWMIAMRLIALFVALGLALGLTAPALAKTADGDTVLAFTSDVHNRAANQSRDRLSAWVDGLSSSIGHFDFMGFCGDMGDATNNATTHDEFWATAKDAFDLMDTKTDKIDAIYYTTGNHEFSPGNFDTTTNACKNYYTVNAEAVNGDDYRIYCLGCDSKSQSYSGDQVTALSNYLAACGTDKPIFVMTHYPLHYLTKGNRSTSNAKGVIDALNAATEAGKTVVLLWGHNHSQGDTRYDHIYEPKTTIDYARNQSTAFNFYYMAAGCMSDDEYVGSSSVEGKGLIVTIDHKTGAITFAYYKKDLTIGKSLTTEPTVPVTKYKVTWVDGDGATIKTEQVAEGKTPSYTGNTPTKTPTAQYSYTFTGWDPTPAPLTADATYTAQFTQQTRTYAITWKDGDGRTLKTDQVAYGQTPSYTGLTPTKASTAQYSYTFNNSWSPAIADVTGDATYTAQFTEQTRSYSITWVDGDGKTLKTDTLAYGQTPSYTGATPTKASTAQYSYTFSNSWSPTIAAVTGEATYTAQFTSTVNSYTITWKNYDGQTLKTDTVAYGTTPSYSGTTPTRPATTEHTYEYSGWSPRVSTVTGDATYTAQYTEAARTYTITWKGDGGQTLRTDQVAYGTTPSYGGATPTKESTTEYSYVFAGWDPEPTAVTGDATYTATFTQTTRTYTITWKDGDGRTLKTDQVEAGKTPAYSGSTPTKTATAQYSYEFNNGWSPTITAVAGDATYNAQFNQQIRSYDITWKDGDGRTLRTDQVAYGETPRYTGGTPTKASTTQYDYEFSNSWSPVIAAVTGEATYTAQFTQTTRTYAITWVDGDGQTLKTEQVAYGTRPSYTGATPTKTATAQYSYTFSNSWSPTITAVTGEKTYTAQFSSTVNSYTITWKNYDDSVLKTDTVAYGTTPSYSGPAPTRPSSGGTTYTFSGWTPGVTAVTGDATYTARFSTSASTYTVTWVDGDGKTIKTDENVTHGTTPRYSGATPTKTATAQYSYEFSGWDPTPAAITGDTTYTAQFTQTTRSYDITWKDGDGRTLRTDQVAYGETPRYTGGTPTKASTAQYDYEFSGSWSPAIAAVTGEATYTAQFTQTTRTYAITWVDGDGQTLKTEQVAYGSTPRYTGSTPTKTATAQYSYTFSNSWSPTITAVTGEKTYTAQFTEQLRSYSITWKNYDGSTLRTDTVAYGTTPSYSGTPTWPATAEYSYEFSGWSPRVSSVTGEATYTAQFTQVTRAYAITWIDGDGKTLKTEQITYGARPSYTGTTPTKAATAQYTYVFNDSWSPTITTVTGDATYTAQFTQTTRNYTITWKDGDGRTLRTDQVAYGSTPRYTGSTPTKASMAQYDYEFSGWDPTPTAVTGDATYTAQFTQTTRSYAITWVDGDGQTLKTEQVAYGTTPSYSGATPTKTATAQYSYSFSGWNPALKAVTGDATYTAQFTSTVNSYTITWKNYDGSTLKTDTVAYGTTPSYSGTMPTRPSSGGVAYTFSGWNPSVTAVTGDATYTARFSSSAEGYTVTWKNSDGTELWVDEDVAYGTTPRYAGATPTKASTAQYDYEFSGWDPTPAAITGDVIYTAQFTQTTRSYAITWVDGDGQTLKTDTVAYGTTPRYTGGTPTKASTAQYSYEFNNSWSPAVTAVTGDATYTAQFTQITRSYAIAWVDGDGRTLRTDTVAYGETPRYTGGTPSKTATAQYSYTFSDSWNPDITAVTGDATYTAQFTQTTRTYTITWVDGDGKTLGADQVAYGSTPSYTGDTPTKKATDDYAYKFDGTWDPAVVAVTEDATYTAHFTATKITPEPPTPQDKWVRLSGQGRYQTMSAIVSEGFKTSSSVVLASGEKFADALVASALAGALDCPIVLTATDELSPEAKQQVMSLHASTVYVVGGRAVISQEVRDQLELLPDVEQLVPLAGKNRTETSRVVADAVVSLDHGVDTVVVATGKNFADALAVSPWCYARHYPIILTGDDGNLTAGQVDDIAGRYAAKHVVIVGGVGAVSQDAQDALEAKSLQVNRWKGKGRYETSAVIAGHVLDDGMSLAHMAVATGNAFPDALAGAALCGRLNAPLLLATDKSDDGLVALDIIREGKADVKQGYVLGGKGSVSDGVFELLEDITE